MRIITGSEKGRKLMTRKGGNVRPTQDRVREAIFNMLGAAVVDCTGLDLFAGFGGLGLEALSRGADCFTFVEKDRRNCGIIKKNIELCGFTDKAILKCSDVEQYLQSTNQKYDLIFMDPPYQKGYTQQSISLLLENGIMAGDCLVVSEVGSREEAPVYSKMEMVRNKEYGDTAVYIYYFKGGK